LKGFLKGLKCNFEVFPRRIYRRRVGPKTLHVETIVPPTKYFVEHTQADTVPPPERTRSYPGIDFAPGPKDNTGNGIRVPCICLLL
jgi:hypothetical protein